MHELLLFAQVPQSRHEQLLNILAGVAGMQPQQVVEKHLIFKPSRPPGQSWAQVGGSQGVQNTQVQALQGQLHNELYYLKLVGEASESIFGDRTVSEARESAPNDFDRRKHERQGGSREGSNGHGPQPVKQTWSLQFRDLPEVAGRRPVTSRMMSNVDIIDGDAVSFMNSLGYSYVPWMDLRFPESVLTRYRYASEYVIEGNRFIHQNLILFLHRILRFPATGQNHQSPRQDSPRFENLTLLDSSGAFLLQASIRIQDGSKPETMSAGINELRTFKELMKGVVDLEIGDRLALDTRFKQGVSS